MSRGPYPPDPNVRDNPGNPRLPVRRQAIPARNDHFGLPGRGPRINLSRLVVVGLFLVFLVGAAAFVAAALGPDPGLRSPGPSGLTGDASPTPQTLSSLPPGVTPGPGDTGAPGETPAPGDSPSPGASPTPSIPIPIGELRMPIVPVVGFWSTDTAISKADLVDALKGNGSRFSRVVVPDEDRAAVAKALGIKIADGVQGGNVTQVQAAVKKGGLGLLRAAEITPQVRALALDGASLFGNDRIKNTDAWPLMVTVQAPTDQAWDQKKTWTMVAGGDMFTDRGIYERVVNRNKGVDYPFDGGTVRVTGHYCCGPPPVTAYEVPSYVFTGNKGIVRTLVENADMTIANFESPVPRNWVFHLHGFVFSSMPQLLPIFSRVGFDWVSLANNHIKDFGSDAIADTRMYLDKAGIKYTGAGKDYRQAGQISYLEAKGTRVAIIACLAVVPSVNAGPSSGGALPCKNRLILPRIAEARKNADLVIVFAHWGVEYSRSPLDSQRASAQAWIDAGADLVLGAHSHVAGAIEEVNGKMIFYSLGNFIFDQNFRTITMESILPEMTFLGNRLVQVDLHPFLQHDQSQPNLLDPATDDGRALLRSVRRASYIDW